MKTAIALYDLVVTALAVLSGIILALMTCAIAAESIRRGLGFGVFRGLIDFSEIGLFCIAILTAPWLLRRNAHLSINVFLERFSPPVRRGVQRLIDLIGLSCCAILCIWGTRVLMRSYQTQQMVFGDYVLMDWWLQWQIPLAALLMALTFAGRLLSPLYTQQGV